MILPMRKYFAPIAVSIVVNFFAFVFVFLPFFPDDAGNTILGDPTNVKFFIYFSALSVIYILYLYIFIKFFSKKLPNSKLKIFLISLPFCAYLTSIVLTMFRFLVTFAIVALINLIAYIQRFI